jgi:DNA-binding transcriptional regulator GbsR (MarR family)
MKTFKEIYEEIERPLSKIFEIAEKDLATHFSGTLSKTALEEIESEYQKIVEILKEFEPQNEVEKRIKEYLSKKRDRLRQAIFLYVWLKDLLEEKF